MTICNLCTANFDGIVYEFSATVTGNGAETVDVRIDAACPRCANYIIDTVGAIPQRIKLFRHFEKIAGGPGVQA